MERKANGPRLNLVVNRRRKVSEILDMMEELSTDQRLTQWEQDFIANLADRDVERVSEFEENKLLEISKKYSN